MIWLQLSANTGPEECCLAVSKALAVLLREAAGMQVAATIVEAVAGPLGGTLRSVLLELDDGDGGGAAALLAACWSGSVQWICESPYRKLHKRKNWFLNGVAFQPPERTFEASAAADIRYEATRASGPGG